MEEEEEVGAGVGDSVGDSGSNLEDANWARLTSAHIPQSTSLPHGTHFAARVVPHRVHLREDRRDFRKVGADVAEFEILLPSSKELWDDVPSSGGTGVGVGAVEGGRGGFIAERRKEEGSEGAAVPECSGTASLPLEELPRVG